MVLPGVITKPVIMTWAARKSTSRVGIVDEDTGQLSIMLNSSYKTSDFIVDALEAEVECVGSPREGWWWRCSRSKWITAQKAMACAPSSCIVWCSLPTTSAKPIQLLYYPPYHSKYNPIERCWGILELHWNGTKLIDVETMLEWAKSMTWKGMQPYRCTQPSRSIKRGFRLASVRCTRSKSAWSATLSRPSGTS